MATDLSEFGVRLKAVREALKLDGIEVARRALGEDSTKKQRRDFANYLSRIERTNGNVSQDMLQKIAKGLGYPSPAIFLFAHERVVLDADTPSINILPTTRLVIENPPLLSGKADDVPTDTGTLSAPALDPASFERIALGAAGLIADTLTRLGEQLEKSRTPDPEPRTKPAPRRRDSRPRVRKTA